VFTVSASRIGLFQRPARGRRGCRERAEGWPGGEGVDHFIVEIPGYVDDEENRLTFQFRPSAKMVWNKTNDPSPRLEIYIPNNLSQRLIELYITKRIDRVELLKKIATFGEGVGNLDLFPQDFPLLAEADRSQTTSLEKN